MIETGGPLRAHHLQELQDSRRIESYLVTQSNHHTITSTIAGIHAIDYALANSDASESADFRIPRCDP